MKLSKCIATTLLFSLLFIFPPVYAQNSGIDAITQATQPAGWALSYEKMWGIKKYENLALLRAFRDEVLSKSELGQIYVAMLYNNSIEIALLLIQKPALRTQTREVLNAAVKELQGQACNNEICVSQNTFDDFVALLDSFQASASPRLKAVIEIVKQDIATGAIDGRIGFTVVE